VATRDIVIEVVGELISKPYIEITLNMLAALRHPSRARRLAALHRSPPAAATARRRDPRRGRRVLGQLLRRARAPSPAARSRAHRGRRAGSIQGDIRFVEAAQQMGAAVTSGPNWLEVRRGAWPLKAIDLDCNHIPDAAMTLAVMALYADGPTTLRNIASWRVKETDRLAAMATELRKLGAEVEEGADFLRVTPPATGARRHPHLRRPPHGDVLRAGRLQSARRAGAHRGPEVRRQDLPGLLRGAVLGGRTAPPHIP
jgi:3-phosphoshikimate 1-carboxyvinyltransferase